MLKYTFIMVLLCIGLSFCTNPTAKEEVDKPNIILILSDDVGYGDISCYGATMINTPNIDKLASQGTQFTNYHTCGAVCKPTRYSILTGRYPIRRPEIEHFNWGDQFNIDPDRLTLADLCKQHGYKTASIGKWHLGYGNDEKADWGSTLTPGPLEIGFDFHWGVPSNHNDNVRGYMENHKLHGLDPNIPYKLATRKTNSVQGLLHERVDDQVDSTLTVKAMEFIKTNKDKPFLVYLTLCAAHTHITPSVRFRGTSNAGQYGDYVHELDSHVGEIMALLDELELAEETILIFTSDNGGQLRDVRSAGLGLNLANESGDVAKKARTAKIDARAMGHMTNLNLREGKGSPYEGGFNVPCIIRWPKYIEAGTRSDKLISSADYLATVADLLGQDIPEVEAEDSYSFADVLTGEVVTNPRTFTVMHSRPGRSFIDGDWKLVDFSYRRSPVDSVELFNLREDPYESIDLSKAEPERLNAMRDKLKEISEGDLR